MTIKKYVSIYIRQTTFVFDENGERHALDFKGGIGGQFKIGGNLSTSDENLQKAIESDKRFGIEFKLKETHVVGEKKAEEKTITPEPVKETEVPLIDNGLEVVESVTNRQDARIYFRDKGEQGLSPQLSSETITKLCQKFNVSFPNLVKK